MMWIDNQKNGTWGGTIHHTALHSKKCLIRHLQGKSTTSWPTSRHPLMISAISSAYFT
jgi:hypothetical protein